MRLTPESVDAGIFRIIEKELKGIPCLKCGATVTEMLSFAINCRGPEEHYCDVRFFSLCAPCFEHVSRTEDLSFIDPKNPKAAGDLQ